MPLPLALAQRLQKRGIISTANEEKQTQLEHHIEEVIAEDYDDINKLNDVKSGSVVIGCPNKYNIYHDCTHYCQKRWSNVSEEPSPQTKRKYHKLLKRYPLTDIWRDVYDPGLHCYYFWNTVTDEVSWLPPHHPKARISLSAEKLRSLLRDDEDEQLDEEGSDASNSDNLMSDNSSDSNDNDSDSSERNKKNSKLQSREKERQNRSKGRPIRKYNDLDPMDPAAYSEIPRGKWSDGLDKKGDAKTGVDSTASGPLFQMRPYPNPGAILRMNKTGKKRTTDSSDED